MIFLKNQKRSISFYFSILLVISAIGIANWKCGIGIGLYDEPYIVAPGFKMLALGDKPFVDEVMNGARHHDLLNHYLIRPLLPYSLKAIRVHAVACYAIALFMMITVAFGFRLPLLGGLLFFIFLVFDSGLLTATWSYNTWPRFGMLLHHAALLLIPRVQRKVQPWLLFTAGVFLALAGLAHFAVLIAVAIAFLFLLPHAFSWTRVSTSQLRTYWPYLAGLALPVFADIIYVLVTGLAHDWLHSMALTVQGTHRVTGGTPHRIWELAKLLIGMSKVELVLIAGILGSIALRGKWRRPILAIFFSALTLRFLMRLNGSLIPNILWVNACLIALIMISAGSLLWIAHRKRDLPLFWLTILPVASMAAMAFFSTVGVTALFWVAPPLVVLAAAHWSHDERVAWVLLGIIAIAVVRTATQTTYYDAPPSECTTVLTVAPFQGIRTSERRAFLIRQMASALEGKRFALAFPLMPWPFLLGDVRSAIPTVGGGVHFDESVYAEFLEQSRKRGRMPEILIHQKEHGWYWGVSEKARADILGNPHVIDEPQAFQDHFEKIRGTLILNFPEYEVFAVTAQAE